jgi:hypothetical protein
LRGREASDRFIPIPPGKSDKKSLPPNDLLLYMRKSAYQQGKNSTCLLDAFCSAFHAFGCSNIVERIRTDPKSKHLDQSNSFVWSDFCELVNHEAKQVGLQVIRHRQLKSFLELLEVDDSFLIIASLKANDGMVGQHAIAIFNNGIYDANCPSQKSLDWCCGEGKEIKCTGIDRCYQLLPKHRNMVKEEMQFVFKAQNSKGCTVLGWVASMSEKKGILIQFSDGIQKRVDSRKEVLKYSRMD